MTERFKPSPLSSSTGPGSNEPAQKLGNPAEFKIPDTAGQLLEGITQDWAANGRPEADKVSQPNFIKRAAEKAFATVKEVGAVATHTVLAGSGYEDLVPARLDWVKGKKPPQEASFGTRLGHRLGQDIIEAIGSTDGVNK
jgi:hypothetical protein